MKIIYIANIRLPTEKAHGVQIMEMCNAFHEAGADVELVIPDRDNSIKENAFSYYGLAPSFAITKLPTWNILGHSRLGFYVQSLSFILTTLWYLRKNRDLIYSRDAALLSVLSFFHARFVFEAHYPKWNYFARPAILRATLLVTITQGLKDFYLKQKIQNERIFVAPDGVNLERFTIKDTRVECRTKLNLPKDNKIVLYAGHLYARKGAHVLADAAKFLPENVVIVFVGGTDADIAGFKDKYGMQKNIRILGRYPHEEIPYFLKSANILVIPNSAKSDDARLYTSPMKLFEYMASDTAIIASDIPSLREILNEKNAAFVSPDDPQALASGIKDLFDKPERAGVLSANAKRDIVNFTWDKRAQDIIATIESSEK